MRIDKYLADITQYSRNDIKKLIKAGAVTIDEMIVSSPDMQVDYGTEVCIDQQVFVYHKDEYYLLNKPAGFICATHDNIHQVVLELIDSPRKDLAIVGRLDKDTEGLLILTTDGELNHRLTSPKTKVEKVYYAETDKAQKDDLKQIIEAPMDLGDFITAGAQYQKLSDHSCLLTITEGKYHQVKRMFEKAGYEVTYLERRKLGFLTLEGVERGEYRSLTEEEIRKLKQI